MSKIHLFFHALFKSLTSLDYYYQIIQSKLSFSIKFFLAFSVFYASLNAVYWYVDYVQPLKPIINSIPNQFIETVYPEDLVIYIQDGQVSLNQEEPYFIGADRLRVFLFQLKDQILGANSHSLDYLLVVDTTAGIEDFYDYNTFALLTKNTLIYLDPSYGQLNSNQLKVKAIPLAGVTAIVNQQFMHQLTAGMVPYLQSLLPFSLFILFLISLLVIPYFHLIYILIISLVALFIVKILDMKLSFTQCFQIGIHLFSAITLVVFFLRIIGIYPFVPALRFSVIIIATIVILVHIKEMMRRRRETLKVS